MSKIDIDGFASWELRDENQLLKQSGVIRNIITQVGGRYYAERSAGVTSPPVQVTGMQLGTGTTPPSTSGAGAALGAVVTNSLVPIDSGFPTSQLSGGKRRITWRCTWIAGVATANGITEVVLVNQALGNQSASPASSTISRILLLTPLDKGATEVFTLIWNHDLGYVTTTEPVPGTVTATGASSPISLPTAELVNGQQYSVVVEDLTNGLTSSAVTFTYTAPVISAPTVSAGADASITVSTPFNRTATEVANGSPITARLWTVVSGPAQVGASLATTAAISWTPTTIGAYVLRYSATNAAGTTPDDVIVTVTAATANLFSTAASGMESTNEYEVAGGNTNTSLALSTAQAKSGTQSLAATAIAGGSVNFGNKTTSRPSITAGTSYTLTCWIRTGAALRYPTVYLRYSGGGNDFLGDFIANPTPAANTWTLVTVTGVAPAGATHARLGIECFGMNPGEDFYLDDVSLTT